MEREFLDVDDEGQTLVVNVIVISSYFGVNKNVYYNIHSFLRGLFITLRNRKKKMYLIRSVTGVRFC